MALYIVRSFSLYNSRLMLELSTMLLNDLWVYMAMSTMAAAASSGNATRTAPERTRTLWMRNSSRRMR